MPTTLPSQYFCSPDIYAQESQRIFNRSWLVVARENDLPDPGGFLTTTVEGHDLLLVRGSDQVRCFHNTCRHRGARLLSACQGTLTNRCIVCPYHAWTYDEAGRLIGAPNMQDASGFHPAAYGLGEIPCVSWLGFLLISLDKQQTSFSDTYDQLTRQFAAWQIESLRTAATWEYDVAANWKLVMQNYSECYHCPTVHPALHQLTDYRSATNDLETGACLGGPMELNDGVETMSVDGARVGDWLPNLNEMQQRQVFFYVLFPNLLLSLHPDYVMAHRLRRIDPCRTQITCEFYFSPEALADPHFHADRAAAFWDEVNRQDWHVCELSQRGVASPGYQPGPYSSYETMLVAFDQYYLDQLEPDRASAEPG